MGAKKLVARLWPEGNAPVSVRTANRILGRHGLTCRHEPADTAPGRFEYADPNALWQMDFKGLKYPRLPYDVLAVIDDASRFCLGLTPVRGQTAEEVWRVLWNLFGEFGLPEGVLSDNGPAFGSCASPLVSSLDVRLMRLGIRSLHGRPYHPQTQGKVERFNGTLEDELGAKLRQPTVEAATRVYANFRTRYNEERPHESLDMQRPAQRYERSPRRRPPCLPRHELAAGALSRCVYEWGNFSLAGVRYRVGRGLAGERVELREVEDGEFAVLYFENVLGYLKHFRVERMS